MRILMPGELIALVLASLLAVIAMRTLPKSKGPGAVSVLSAVGLVLVSWQSAVWLACGVILTLCAMAVGDRIASRTAAFLLATTFHVLMLIVLRDFPGLALMGGAYFTLRHIQVLSDWWTGKLERPGVAAYIGYHLFLPTLAAGPIHQFLPFQRQLMRRRNDIADLTAGAERLLWGAFQYTVLGGWLMTRVKREFTSELENISDFLRNWIISPIDWIALYLSFAGLSSMAIGLALMMGLRIEENFNRPWQATDLLDFWTRWHMTLTGFSRNYIFRPISAVTRSGVLGVFSAMIFLGLWHGSSLYWIVWGLWQGLGILLTMYGKTTGLFVNFPGWSGRIFAALWLTATLPIISFIAGTAP